MYPKLFPKKNVLSWKLCILCATSFSYGTTFKVDGNWWNNQECQQCTENPKVAQS